MAASARLHRHAPVRRSARARAWAGLAALAALIYPIPDPLDGEEAAQRASQRDVPNLTIPELERELGLLRLRLLVEPGAADAWLAERQAALAQELARREGARRGR